MGKIILILIVALFMEAVGVVFLSGGLKQIGEPQKISTSEIVQLLKRGATNRNILIGILFETIFFGALIYLLSQQDVSFVWPMTSLGFVITTVAAKIFLHEQISLSRWAGVLLIVSGAALVSFSEKAKEKKNPAAPSTQSLNP